MTKKPVDSAKPKSYVVAKTDDGTLQITYTIAADVIKKAQEVVVAEHAKTIEIPGFRKGKAPTQKVLAKIPQNTLLEKTLARLLPKLLSETIKTEGLRIAIYPKFELISAKEGEAWQIRAVTCEAPTVELPDYKAVVAGEMRSQSLKKQLSHEEKEGIALASLLKLAKVTIPKVLLEEEVSSRLSKLLERLEKLGLSLEKYVESLGKKIEDLKSDYEKQSREALILDLALLHLAQKENVTVEEKEINAAIATSAADPELAKRLDTPEQRNAVRAVLMKKGALEKLVHL